MHSTLENYFVILYDWGKIVAKSRGKVDRVLSIVSYITFPHMPLNRYDSTYLLSKIDWSGDSFIINPEKIFTNRNNYSDGELAQYIALASVRSVVDYALTNKRTLSLHQCPVDLDLVTNHRLLTLVNDEIHFHWEEVTH